MSNNFGDLGQLKPAPGAIKKPKRIGRGRGSGHGDTATRGHKGAQSRAGYKQRRGFEGGQMPLQRRIPKRGFVVYGRTEYNEVKLDDLSRIQDEAVNPESMRKARLVKGRGPIVLLGTGSIDRPVKVSVHRITGTARSKIETAGGSIDILPLDPEDRRIKKGPTKRSKNKSLPK